MSVEALAIVLNHSKARGTARLVLIGIANHDGDGGSWPSLDTLTRYAAVDRSNVLRALTKLEQLNEIRRFRQQGGTVHTADHRRPNLYEFRLTCPADCDGSKKHRTRQVQGAFNLSTGVAEAPPHALSTGVAEAPRGGVAEAPPEPSIEPSTSPAAVEPALDRAWTDRTHRYLGESNWCEDCGLSRDGTAQMDLDTGRWTAVAS